MSVQLAPDCVGHAVSFVSSSRIFFRILQVSSAVYRHFHSYGADCCRNIDFRVSPDPQYLQERDLRDIPYVLILSIKGWNGYWRSSYPDYGFLSHFPKIQSLNLSFLDDFDFSNLLHLGPSSRESLTKIAIHQLRFAGTQARAQHLIALSGVLSAFPGLKTLQYRGLYGEKDTFHVPAGLKLKVLSVAQSAAPDLLSELQDSANTLESLILADPVTNLVSMEAFSGFPNLRIIKFDELPSMKSPLVLFEALPASVRCLSVCLQRPSTFHGEPVLTQEALLHLPPLRKFTIARFRVEYDFLFGLKPGNLELLSLKRLRGNFGGVERYEDTLKTLSVLSCSDLDFDVSDGFKVLSALRCTYSKGVRCSRIPDLQNLKALKLTDDSAAMIGDILCLPERSLVLRDLEAPYYNDQPLADILQRIDPLSLRRLELYGCKNVNDALLSNFVALEQCCVSGTVNVSGSFLPSMPSLKHLYVDGKGQLVSLTDCPISLLRLRLKKVDVSPEALVLPNHILRYVSLNEYGELDSDKQEYPRSRLRRIFLPQAEFVTIHMCDLSRVEFRAAEMFGKLRRLQLERITDAQKTEILSWCSPAIVRLNLVACL